MPSHEVPKPGDRAPEHAQGMAHHHERHEEGTFSRNPRDRRPARGAIRKRDGEAKVSTDPPRPRHRVQHVARVEPPDRPVVRERPLPSREKLATSEDAHRPQEDGAEYGEGRAARDRPAGARVRYRTISSYARVIMSWYSLSRHLARVAREILGRHALEESSRLLALMRAAPCRDPRPGTSRSAPRWPAPAPPGWRCNRCSAWPCPGWPPRAAPRGRGGRWAARARQRRRHRLVHPPLVLPRHELVDPHHAHPDLAPVQRVQRPRVAVGDHHALVEVAQGGDRLPDRPVLALVHRALGQLLVEAGLPVHPAHGEAHPDTPPLMPL
jgi:hypothetical protein